MKRKQFGPIVLAALSLLIASVLTSCTTPLDFSYRSNVRKVQSALDEIKPPLSTWQLSDEGIGARSICFNWGGCPGAYRIWDALPPVNRAKLVAVFESAGWTVLTVKESDPDCIPLPGSTRGGSGNVCVFTFERDDLYASLIVSEINPTSVRIDVDLKKYDR